MAEGSWKDPSGWGIGVTCCVQRGGNRRAPLADGIARAKTWGWGWEVQSTFGKQQEPGMTKAEEAGPEGPWPSDPGVQTWSHAASSPGSPWYPGPPHPWLLFWILHTPSPQCPSPHFTCNIPSRAFWEPGWSFLGLPGICKAVEPHPGCTSLDWVPASQASFHQREYLLPAVCPCLSFPSHAHLCLTPSPSIGFYLPSPWVCPLHHPELYSLANSLTFIQHLFSEHCVRINYFPFTTFLLRNRFRGARYFSTFTQAELEFKPMSVWLQSLWLEAPDSISSLVWSHPLVTGDGCYYQLWGRNWGTS